MMLDIDYFKRINDDFGTASGDLALKHVSSLLSGALRDVDSLARYGGEFVVLMREQLWPTPNRLRNVCAHCSTRHRWPTALILCRCRSASASRNGCMRRRRVAVVIAR